MNWRNKIISICILFSGMKATAQCPGGITSFPYNERFETGNGSWIPGGISSDWAWGIPAKPVISTAGEGNRCWMIGGLSGSAYNNGERSWLQSPCFDFTGLAHPEISFKVFWETEKKFDGASFQYSINNGATWNYLGAAGTDDGCSVVNWYNNGNITYLSGNAGWSGNKQPTTGSCQGGSGSINWVQAKHEMNILAGKPGVIFRFEFGAGTTCNNFDGFAIDDINIYEAVPNTADFSYTCKPSLGVDFVSTSSCALTLAWDFGDPASVPNNTSSSPNPSHTFSSPGTYNVKLTATFAGGITSVKTKPVTVLGAATNLDQAITCGGTFTAIITASGAGSTNPYSYVWNTNPPQTTATISGLPAGSYTVTVNSGTACPAQSTITVTEPTPLTVTGLATDALCLSTNGSVTTNVSGGTTPYTYMWNDGSTNASLTGLAAGNYHVDVKDANGCITPADFVVDHRNKNLPVNLGADAFICPGEKLVLNAGTYDSYLWQDLSTNPTFTVTQTGNYSVTVTDVNGCTGSDAIKVVVDCSDIYFPDVFTPNGDGRNEFFGPAGTNLGAVKNYSLHIYNRYGELVFTSIDPYKKWDGRYAGKYAVNGAYVWMVSYSLNNKSFNKKSTVLLVR